MADKKKSGMEASMLALTIITAVIAIITLLIAWCTYGVAVHADETAVTMDSFKVLLSKTNAQLSTLQNQLVLDKQEKQAIDQGNKSRFISAIFLLGATIGNRDSALKLNGHEDEISAKELAGELQAILESQMNNPFLCEDTAMLRRWVNAYVHLNILGHEGEFGNSFSNDFNIRVKSRIDDISKIKMSRSFISAWDAANDAYLFCGKRLLDQTNKYLQP